MPGRLRGQDVGEPVVRQSTAGLSQQSDPCPSSGQWECLHRGSIIILCSTVAQTEIVLCLLCLNGPNKCLCSSLAAHLSVSAQLLYRFPCLARHANACNFTMRFFRWKQSCSVKDVQALVLAFVHLDIAAYRQLFSSKWSVSMPDHVWFQP